MYISNKDNLSFVMFSFLQFSFGVVDEAIKELTDTFGTEAFSFGYPEWTKNRCAPSLQTLVEHRS
jgi:hypothetical protein